jgi:hypothetical protein
MPKIKLCPHCSKTLYCKACGVRYTPELKNRRSMGVSDEVLEAIKNKAKEEGVGIEVFLARRFGKAGKVEKDESSKSGRRRAG